MLRWEDNIRRDLNKLVSIWKNIFKSRILVWAGLVAMQNFNNKKETPRKAYKYNIRIDCKEVGLNTETYI